MPKAGSSDWLPILWLETGDGRFLLRGREKARTELGLLALAFKFNRLNNLHGARAMQEALA